MQSSKTRAGIRLCKAPRKCRVNIRDERRPAFGRSKSEHRHKGSVTQRRIYCQAAREQVELLQATIYGESAQTEDRKLLVYFPGTDGTGNAISPQLPGLLEAGFDVRALYIPPSDRSNWEALTHEAVKVLRKLVESHGSQKKVTLVAESFGGCLALRVAKEAPDLLERMVLVNPATAFANSWGGLLNILASTQLLSVFPKPLYQVAQAVLLPFLVDKENVGELGIEAVQQMIDMSPPSNRSAAELYTDPTQIRDPTPSFLQQFESHEPAAAGSWRLSLLCSGNVSDFHLSSIKLPILLISSAKDRLLNSLEEGARLERNLGNAMRVVLPKSGHTALLEEDVHLIDIMQCANFLPKDLEDKSYSRPEIYTDTPFRQRFGNETEPLQRKSRQYALDAIRKQHRGGQVGGSRALVPGLNWSRSAIASTSASASYENGSDMERRPLQVLQEMQYQGTDKNGSNASYSNGVINGDARVGQTLRGSSAFPDLEQISGQNGATRISTQNLNDSPQNRSSRSWSSQNGSTRTEAFTQENERENSELGNRSLKEQKKAPWGHPDPRFDQTIAVLSPFRELISPVVRGLENLPSASETNRPLLFVGNHARIGLYDMPYLIIELYLRRIKVRGLAHPAHWRSPLGSFFEFFGAVKASPRSAYKLLKNGEAVLLFPGGGREVNKRKGEDYQLFWSEEPDFVRMAAKLNALIIPFASVGGDEAFDIAYDSDEVIHHPVFGGLAKNALKNMDPKLDIGEAVPPVTKIPGLGLPSPIPIANLSRLYFRFMPVIDPNEGGDVIKNRDFACEVYKDVKKQVYEGIHLLQEEQKSDPKNSLTSRVIEQISRFLPAFDVLR